MKSEFQRGVIWINHRRLITITCNITCSGYLDGLRSFGISVRNTRVYTYLSHPYSVCDRCAYNANPLFSVSQDTTTVHRFCKHMFSLNLPLSIMLNPFVTAGFFTFCFKMQIMRHTEYFCLQVTIC